MRLLVFDDMTMTRCADRFFGLWAGWLAAMCVCFGVAKGDGIHHYVFFGRDREQITNPAFLDTKAFEGAQLKYAWRELEHTKDEYDFGDIEHDLSFLQAKGKKLFIQVQDSSFDVNIRPFPHYLL